MKKLSIILLVFVLILMTGCEDNNNETEKNDYIALKSTLVETTSFNKGEDINFDIVIKVDRIDEETVSYTTTISNPKEDMHNIKMLVVHNFFTEEVFPTVGIFDEKKELLTNNDNKISLVGYIETTKDIKRLDLEIKVWLQYTDNDGNKKDIYYKTTK